MASSFNANSSINSTVDSLRLSLSSNVNTTTTSSNALGETLTVYGNTWTSIGLTGLTNVAVLYVLNDNTVNTASIIQISGSTITNPVGTILQPGQGTSLFWSGSIGNVFASVVNGSTLTGSLQYIAQQA